MNTKKLLNNVLGVTEITFLTKRAMFHPLKQRGCYWMEDSFLEASFTFEKCFIILYNYMCIYIYIYYTYNYASYTYFTLYVEVFVCFEIFRLTSGLCVCNGAHKTRGMRIHLQAFIA